MDVRRIRIVGSGVALPQRRVSDTELDRHLGLKPGTSFEQTGVRRRHLSESETAAELAAEACRKAMADAELGWDDIDCLVCASATMDQALPYNAALVHAELGLSERRTTTFDIGASCMSFLTALDTISYAVECGRYRHVLLVSADIATFGIDWSRLKEGGIFGDGAAAVVIRRSAEGESSRILASHSVTLSRGVEYCQIPAGGSRFHPKRLHGPIEPLSLFQMQGRSVFKLVAEAMPAFVDDLMQAADLPLSRIAKVVPHQASRLALDHMAKRLQIGRERLVDIFEEHGNQVGASLPTALHHGLKSGVRRGDPLLLVGTGAGLTMGGMVLVY